MPGSQQGEPGRGGLLIGNEVVLYPEGVLGRRENPVRPKGGRPEGAVGDV